MKKHGMCETRIYSSWRSMKDRCESKNSTSYHRYGARGIKIEWKSFEDFRKDMEESFLEHEKLHGGRQTSIDRIDGSKNYSKENCRWATSKEQNRNRKDNQYYVYKGDRQTLPALFEKYGGSIGLDFNGFHQRVRKYGWSIEEALETPRVHGNYNGRPRKK